MHDFFNFSQALAGFASFLTAISVLVLNWRKEKKQEDQSTISNYQQLYNNILKERNKLQKENDKLRTELEELKHEHD